MRRGDIVIVAVQGDHGKPRPALVVQNDLVSSIDTTLVCLTTTNTEIDADFRLLIMPSLGNGLREQSYVMLDKTTMVLRQKCRGVIGRLTADEMSDIDARLAFILGLAD